MQRRIILIAVAICAVLLVIVFAGGDIVVAVDGKLVANFNDLLGDVAFDNPGDQVVLTVLRDGKQQDIPVTLEARPALHTAATTQ